MLPVLSDATPRRRPRLWPSLLLAIGASMTIYLVFYGANYRLPFLVPFAICVGLALLRWTLALVAEPVGLGAADLVRPVEVRRRHEPGAWYEGGDGVVEAVGRWDRRLGWGEMDGPRFAHTVGRALGELVDERLRQRYGFTRATDPGRARAVLGERVWRLLGPLERPPTTREVRAALDDLERMPTELDPTPRKDIQ